MYEFGVIVPVILDLDECVAFYLSVGAADNGQSGVGGFLGLRVAGSNANESVSRDPDRGSARLYACAPAGDSEAAPEITDLEVLNE